MICILRNYSERGIEKRFHSDLPISHQLAYHCDLIIKNGMTVKYRQGKLTKVFEPVITDTEDEIIIHIKKDHATLE